MKKYFHDFVAQLLPVFILFVLCASAGAQDPAGGYVSRKEYGWNALAGSRETRQMTTDSSSTNKGESSMQLSGEELWSNNCQRCHNIRPPTMYSNAQWDVIVHHMRVRANITGSEQRAIVEFLKSSSH